MKDRRARPLISVVTAVRNGAADIRHTIDSVLGQTYPNVEYIVVDGASADDTLAIVQSYGDRIAHVISEPDRGLYDGLSKGFARARGDILCYINAGDFFLPHALAVVAEVFADPAIDWLVGCSMACNTRNEITTADLSFRFRRPLIRRGSYGTGLPYIPQESVFWRASLMATVDHDRWTAFRLAGDYFLWWSFATKADLVVIGSPLAVFKRQPGQLSENAAGYHAELASFTESRGPWTRLQEFFERAMWMISPRQRARLFHSVLRYDHKAGRWQWRQW